MNGPPSAVQSVDRAFLVLEVLADADGSATLQELAARTDLPAATVHRLLRTMMARGMVRQEPDRRYALDVGLIRLGDAAGLVVGAWVRPVLARLVEAVGETVNLAIRDGDRAVYVAQVPSPHPMRMFTEVGARVMLHCTGVGKAMLAEDSEAEVRAVLARTGMPARTGHTLTDPDALLAALATTRECGYAVDDLEQEEGVRCVAAATLVGGRAAAVSISGPAFRLTRDRIATVAPHVIAAARAVGEAAHRS